nr:hypothetical protein [Tanacetum cinerariifolium]
MPEALVPRTGTYRKQSMRSGEDDVTGSLCISRAKLDEGLVQSILIGCPVLEDLELIKCYGYKRLDVTTKSVKNLVLSGYGYHEFRFAVRSWMHDDIIEINAPYIGSLTFRKRLFLWKVILLNVSSLMKAKLNYKRGYYEKTKEEAEEDMLKGLIQSLSHVKDLTIGSFSFKVFYRLKAEGFIFPSNLKVVDSDSMELWPDDGREGTMA